MRKGDLVRLADPTTRHGREIRGVVAKVESKKGLARVRWDNWEGTAPHELTTLVVVEEGMI